MKFIICIIGLLFLAIASNEAGSLRKQSLQQRAKSLRALVAKTNPQEASADKESTSKIHKVIMQELKEILAGFNHEKTMYETVAKHLCYGNLSTSLSTMGKTIGLRETIKVSSPCSETSLFGRDLKVFYKHLEECPLVDVETKKVHTKVLDMEKRLHDLETNYTRALENFDREHCTQLDQEEMHKSVVRVFDTLAKVFAKHLRKHYGTDATPQTSSDTTNPADSAGTTAAPNAEPSEDPAQIANAQQENASATPPTALLQVNPEASGKGRIKLLQWTLERLHERMRARHEVEKNQTAALRKAWEIEYQEWMRKINAVNRTLNDLVSREGYVSREGKVCSCAIHLQTHYYASQRELSFHIKGPQFYETGALEKHILENDAKVRANSNSTVLLQVPPIRVLDSGFVPQMCASQASTFITKAVQNAVSTHNSLKEKYDQLLLNIHDMEQIGKLMNKILLPLMDSQVLKTVDEVFDKSMMHKTVLAGPDHREWVVGPNDYFNSMKRYYRFKAAAPDENVELVLEKVDLECHYDYVKYYESTDCNDDVAKEAMYAKDSPKICNTVERGADPSAYPFTEPNKRLSGRCIYIKLYSDYMVSGNSLELHYAAKKYEGVKARYNSIK